MLDVSFDFTRSRTLYVSLPRPALEALSIVSTTAENGWLWLTFGYK
jgi:hypothetical protein